jgi:hypothetical protein
MTDAKVWIELKVFGHDRHLHEVANRGAVQEGTNRISKNVIRQIQNGRTCTRRVFGCVLFLPSWQLVHRVLFHARHDELQVS